MRTSHKKHFLNLVVIFLAFVSISPRVVAQESMQKTDRQLVYAAAEDYILGLYNANPDRIERSVDTLLRKIGYYDYNGESYSHMPMTYQQLYELSGTWNAKGDRANADSPKKIEIYEVHDRTASVKLTAEWGIDFMHLSKTDGKWKILNIMWQTSPEE